MKYLETPYVACISEKIQRIFKPLNVRLVNKAANTIRSHLSHLKYKIDKQNKNKM